MVFSSPSTLWALGLLSIPIFIHLFQFRRYKKLDFPDITLFKEIKARSQTKNQLKHLLILFSRLLLIACLVFAFSEPFIPAQTGSANQESDLVSIYLDNSFSMSAQDEQGVLLDEASQLAFRIAEAYPEGTRFHLFTNAFGIKEKRDLSFQDLQERLDGLSLSAEHRSLEEVLAFQSQALADLESATPKSYLISDFNRMLPIGERTVSDNGSTSLLVLDPLETQNISIDSIWTNSPLIQKGVEQTFFMRLSNRGNTQQRDRRIDVQINDQVVASLILSIEGLSSLDTSFIYQPSHEGPYEGKIRLDDQPITFDNTLYFSFDALSKIKAVEISPNLDQDSPFARLFHSESTAYYKLHPEGLIQDSLNDADLIILNEIEEWNNGLSAICKEHASQGKNVLLVPPSKISEPLSAVYADLFQVSVNGTDTQQAEVLEVNTDATLFVDVFDEATEDINLPVVKQYHTLANNTISENLLPLPNGQSLLASNGFEQAKVYWISGPLSAGWSNLATHALFVPSVLRMAMLSGLTTPLYYPAGTDKLFYSVNDDDLRLQDQNNGRLVIPAKSYDGLLINGAIQEEGSFALFSMADTQSVKHYFSFNHNRSESTIKPTAPNEVLEAFAEQDRVSILSDPTSASTDLVRTADLGTPLWSYFIALAILFFLIELVLLKIFKQ